MEYIHLSLERRLYEAKKVSPPQGFRESLKAFLFSHIGEKNEIWFSQKMRRVETLEGVAEAKRRIWNRLISSIEPFEHTFLETIRTFFQKPIIIIMLGGIIAGALSLFFLFRFLSGTESLAHPQTALLSALGDVRLIQSESGVQEPVTSGEKFFHGAKIQTGDNSEAQIVFFDDSYVRMDANSIVSIQKNLPHPSFADTGEIEITLEQGRIWVRTFADPTDGSSFSIVSGSIVIVPSSGAIDVSKQGNETFVRVWERSARISDRSKQESSIFIAGSKISFFVIEQTTIGPIVSSEKNQDWSRQNFSADQQYRELRLQSILTRYRKDTGVLPGSWLYLAKTWFEKSTFSAGSIEKYLQILPKRFQEAILLAEKGKVIEAQKALIAGSQAVQSLLDIEPEAEPFGHYIFLRAKKDLTAPPLGSPFENLRPFISAAEADVFFSNPFYLHQNLLENLWSIQRILFDSKSLASRDQFDQYLAQKELLSNTVTQNPTEKRALLRLKTEELRLLDFLYAKTFATKDILTAESIVIEEILAIVEEKQNVDHLLWNPDAYSKEENPVDIFLNQVAIYTTQQARQNQTLQLLTEFNSDIHSLPLLQEIRKEIDRDLRTLITDKMAAIIEAQRNKILGTS